MALVSVTLFTACSSDDDDAVNPVFPQVQTIAGAAGDELDFTFDANESWSLSSDKIWCKLVQIRYRRKKIQSKLTKKLRSKQTRKPRFKP